MENRTLRQIALDVARRRTQDRDEVTKQFKARDGDGRKARALSVVPQDRFDEKIAQIQELGKGHGLSLTSNTESVMFAIDLAIEVLSDGAQL